MQAEAALWLPDTLIVYRVTATETDGMGGQDETWTEVDDGACSVADLSGRELERAARLSADATVGVRVNTSLDVRHDDRLVVTIAATGRERLLQVAAPKPDRSWLTSPKLLCTELDPV